MGMATTVALARVLANRKQQSKERDEHGHLEYYVSPDSGAVQFRRAADVTDGAGFAAGRCDCDECQRKRRWRRFAHARFTPYEQHHRRFLFWATRLGMTDDGKVVCWAWIEVIADPDWDRPPVVEDDDRADPGASGFEAARAAIAAHQAADYVGRLVAFGFAKKVLRGMTSGELWGLLVEVDHSVSRYVECGGQI